MFTFTHMFLAMALADIFRLPKFPAFLAAFVIDLDIILNFTGLGLPFTHRGFIHTPIFLAALTAIWYYGKKAYAKKESKAALSFGVGSVSHVMLDFLTNRGVMLLFPLTTFFVIPMADYANLFANAGISLLSIAVVLLYRYRPEMFKDKSRSQTLIRFAVFVALVVVITCVSGMFETPVIDPFVPYY